jgi:hypothetical protein
MKVSILANNAFGRSEPPPLATATKLCCYILDFQHATVILENPPSTQHLQPFGKLRTAFQAHSIFAAKFQKGSEGPVGRWLASVSNINKVEQAESFVSLMKAR